MPTSHHLMPARHRVMPAAAAASSVSQRASMRVCGMASEGFSVSVRVCPHLAEPAVWRCSGHNKPSSWAMTAKRGRRCGQREGERGGSRGRGGAENAATERAEERDDKQQRRGHARSCLDLRLAVRLAPDELAALLARVRKERIVHRAMRAIARHLGARRERAARRRGAGSRRGGRRSTACLACDFA
jgi:hypothetical protein